jgi:trimethylamine--corrinoid protein Co-methyltransferase
MQYFSFLNDDQARYVHEASLEVLEEVGLIVRNEKARHRFAEFGADVDQSSELVKIPGPVVEKYRALIPPTIWTIRPSW